MHSEDEDDHSKATPEEDLQDEDDEPLFLRRDIPSILDAPEIHEQLLQLWKLRQKASLHLVKALDEDDSDLFEKLETTMRQMNQRMHQVLREYREADVTDHGQTTYVDVDSLPIPPAGSSSSRVPIVFSPGQSVEERFQTIEVILDYENNQVFRELSVDASNLDVHHLAIEYLMNDFNKQVTNFADFILTCNDQEIPFRGFIWEIPIEDGATVNIAFREKGNRTPDPQTSTRVQSSCPGGSSRGYHREESHSLKSARASSRPGKNGEANPSGSSRGNQRGESHSLASVRESRGNPGIPKESEGSKSHLAYRVPSSTSEPKIPTTPRGVPKFHPDPTAPIEAYKDAPHDDHPSMQIHPTMPSRSGSYDKIKQSFKCPRFSGQHKDWKQWNMGFVRYLSIWDLEHVLHPDFIMEGYPLSPIKRQDNKMVFLIIEDAVQSAPMAASYVRKAPSMNGFEAYYTLHDGYVFAGATTSTLLLNELSNFRFLPNETPTALVLRLEELFQELELLPSEAAVTFIDTQKIGYLLNALRHEEEWNVVCSYITSAQIKGQITFREACEELKVRCETARAHDMLDRSVKGRKVQTHLAQSKDPETPVAEEWTEQVKTFISTVSKRLNLNSGETGASGAKSKKKRNVQKECLADGCDQKSPFSLCGIHYHSLVSAKVPFVKLRNGYGDATYNESTKFIDYPSKTPADRLPSNAPRKVKVGLTDVKA
jgi:hypothetical protein